MWKICIVWITGIALMVITFIIYSTALVAVRKNNFELFFYSHHLFILFFILLLIHGSGTLNPNFYKWFIIPGVLYLFERILRYYESNKTVGIVSVTHMNNEHAKVYCIELEKPKYHPIYNHKEGQYIFINVPIISKYEWHPFTISSSPHCKTLTVHIRNMGPNTWTGKLQNYLEKLTPNKAYCKLVHREYNKLLPKTIGPDGSKFIRVDGPISAPTQHLGKYNTSLIIGAGIGVTPLRASLLSIVYYRFKKGIGSTYPDNVYAVWIVNYKQLDAYRFMMRTLKEINQELYNIRHKNEEQMKQKKLKIYVFVTSVPENPSYNLAEVLNENNDKNRDLELWGTDYNYNNKLRSNTTSKPTQIHNTSVIKNNAEFHKKTHSTRFKSRVNLFEIENIFEPFNEIDLYKSLKKPIKNEIISLGDIYINNGRPKWNNIFELIKKEHKNEKIGVMYCGPDIISKDLKYNCGKHSDLCNGTKFLLHKENF